MEGIKGILDKFSDICVYCCFGDDARNVFIFMSDFELDTTGFSGISVLRQLI